MTRAAIAAALVALAACAPRAIMRDGVAIPYEQAAQQDLERAGAHFEAGSLEEARSALERLLAELPQSRRVPDALLLLGEVFHASGDAEHAALTWSRIVREHPRSRPAAEASLRAARSYRDIGRPELGRRVLEDAPFQRASQAERVRMYRLLADLARAAGDYPAAVRALALTRRDAHDEETLRDLDSELEDLIADRLRATELEAVARELPRGPVYDRVLLELAKRQLGRGEYRAALATLDGLPRRLRPRDETERQRLVRLARRGTETAAYPVGVALPLSGPYASFGQTALRGIALGLEVFADPPGRYRVVVRDTAGDPAQVGQAMRDLVNEGVRAVIGPMSSSVANAAAPHAESARVPLLTLAKHEDTSSLGEYVFRLGLAPADQIPLLAEHVVRNGPTGRFAVLYPRDSQGVRFKNQFWDEMERRGGTIAGVEGYDVQAVDVQNEIRKLVGLYYITSEERALLAERDRLLKRPVENAERLADPELAELPPYVDFDALFIPDVAERVGVILPQLRFYDIADVILLGPNDWNDPRLVEIAGRDARGAVFTAAFHADSQDAHVRDFVARFYRAYGAAPDLWAATGHDAAALLQTVVDRLGHPSSDQLLNELFQLDEFRGVSGLSGFDADGAPVRELQLLRVWRQQIVALDDGR